MKIAMAQINTRVGDIEQNTKKILEYYRYAVVANSDIIAFPELAITGYPLKDMVLNDRFIKESRDALDLIVRETKGKECAILAGLPIKKDGDTYNACAFICDGEIVDITKKFHLPNYGVFDEGMYFSAGTRPKTFSFKGRKIGISICYDLWMDQLPQMLKEQGAEIIISMNSSPYVYKKHLKRTALLKKTAQENDLPVIYVNQFGGQDSVIFDGGSFAVNALGDTTVAPQFWTEDLIFCKWDGKKELVAQDHNPEKYSDTEQTYCAIAKGFKDYVRKNDFSKAVVPIYGSLNDALCASVACDALGAENVTLINIVSQFSHAKTITAINELSQNLDCHMYTVHLDDILKNIAISIEQIKEENQDLDSDYRMKSGVCGSMLSTISKKLNSILVCTIDKTRYAIGSYSLYGDACGGISTIGDLYQKYLPELARVRNAKIPKKYPNASKSPIPEFFISNLSPNTKKIENIKNPETLDGIIECMIEKSMHPLDVINLGFDKDDVRMIAQYIQKAEYKRLQSPPSIKVSDLVFSAGRRYPITNNYHF